MWFLCSGWALFCQNRKLFSALLPLWLSWWRICLQCGTPGFDPWVGKIPWRRERLPTPVFWPREFHGLHAVAKSRTRLSDFHFHSALRVCAHMLQLCLDLRPYELQPTRLLNPWDSQGKTTGVGFHAFLQGIFLTQGLNPHFLYYRQILYRQSHWGSPSSVF